MSDKKETKVLSLKDKLLKNSTVDLTATLDKSKIFGKKDVITTRIPALNVALSGDPDGGLVPGMLMIAGPSRHFKTAFALVMISSFLQKYPDGMILFYDNEFGSPEAYFKGFNIPLDKVVHTPIKTIEELRTDISNQLENLTREDKVLIMIDSVGNLASAKEVKDALDGSEKADMTRAKVFKSLWRIVTPHLTLKDIPAVVINHTYGSMDMYSKQVVSGGTGGMLSSDNVWIIGRQQDKDGNEIAGYNFIINIEKSRYVKEKSKIPISVSFESGINRWSGLFDLALEGSYITRTKPGWYCKVNKETGEVITDKSYREDDIIDNGEFWQNMFKTTNFKSWIKEKYILESTDMLSEEVIA
jgi:RecA/RadA recombinase